LILYIAFARAVGTACKRAAGLNGIINLGHLTSGDQWRYFAHAIDLRGLAHFFGDQGSSG
jgi:hypothetical protein